VSAVLPGPLVFVDIDTQRDFIEPTGALYVPGAIEIIPRLARLTQFALNRGVPILATACSHRPDDTELERFPPHCMAGTPGSERIAATACPGSIVLAVGSHLPVTGSLPPHVTLEKRELDVFSREDATDLIARYNEHSPLFVVYGVATDYCVKAAATGLLARGCRVALVADAIRAIHPAAEAETLTHLARVGALLTVSAVVCNDSPVEPVLQARPGARA
jgi:nicotinamidase/pyrazinamidase